MKGKGFYQLAWHLSDTKWHLWLCFFLANFQKKMPFNLFQLNWAKWIHFTKQICSTETAVSTDTQKILLIRQNLPKTTTTKKTYFCTAILHHLWAKFFKLESISFHYFSPRTLKIKQVWTLDFGKGGAKRRLNGVNKWKKNPWIFFAAAIYTLHEQKFSNLRPLLSITFTEGFHKLKEFAHQKSFFILFFSIFVKAEYWYW